MKKVVAKGKILRIITLAGREGIRGIDPWKRQRIDGQQKRLALLVKEVSKNEDDCLSWVPGKEKKR